MNSFEGIKLLETVAKHNIAACTEVSVYGANLFTVFVASFEM
jgi:hypothetical protein